MTDSLDIKGEEKALQAARARKLAVSIRRAWEREGYRPRAHLEHVIGDGDPAVLNSFWEREQYGARPPSSYFACRDLEEIGAAIRAGRA